MKKRLLKFATVFFGILMFLNKVNAADTNFFNEKTISRENFNATLNSNSDTVFLGISKERKSNNWYAFNTTTVNEYKYVWKIAKYPSESATLNNADYSDTYYCLNSGKGFGYASGSMTNGNIDTFNKQYDIKNEEDVNKIKIALDWTLENDSEFQTKYNKVYWILENLYIPTQSNDYKTSNTYKEFMNNAKITISKDATDLTEEDIEVVQQMAIWYITNGNYVNENEKLPSLYLNENQISSIVESGEYGKQNEVGKARVEKAEKLFKYLLDSAKANSETRYVPQIPTLNLSKVNANIQGDGEYYIAGPFKLEGTNISLIKQIIPTVNVNNYKLLDDSKNEVTNNNFVDVINKNFYIKFPNRFITEEQKIEISLKYTYETRMLTLYTDDTNSTQPVIKIDFKDIEKVINTDIDLSFATVTIIKAWDDNNNQDGKRPKSIKIQLYANEVAYGNSITLSAGEDGVWQENELTYTWSKLLKGVTYTVKELNANGDAIQNNGNYNTDYTVKYYEDGAFPSYQFTITNKHIPNVKKDLDFSLRKFITEVKSVDNTIKKYSRQPQVDASKIGTSNGKGNIITTATYKHSKQPVSVQRGDIVTYTIRVYNEGEIDGYVNMITDHLPDNLIPIIEGVTGIDSKKYAEEIEFNTNWLWVAIDSNTVSTNITKKQQDGEEIYAELTGLTNVTDTKLDAHIDGSKDLDFIDVQLKCLVADTAVRGEYITNIAEIITAQDINGVQGDGADSVVANAVITNLKDYKNSEALSSNDESYIEGQEDDDDFEKLIVDEFDLSLRKFIVKVNDKSYSREPQVDTSKIGTLDGKGNIITTATYTHTKEPVIVKTDDIVTYKIRIYNEGTIAGYANEITDNIPEGLEFLPNSSKNVEYKWKMLDKDGKETEDVSKAVIIKTDYLSSSNNIIKAINQKDEEKVLEFKDVEVQFKVIAKPEKLQDNIIINEAQISQDSDQDIDSIPHRDEKYDYNTGKNEDDIDYEPIKLQYFDLALRKFITKVNTTDYNNRYPEVELLENSDIKYSHTKEPVIVETGDTVIYTIRIYNEGEISGTATQIQDNIPEGLEFLPDNEVNKKYNWKMLDENGEFTDDVTKAKEVISDSLKNEIIAAFISNESQKILSYKDVKIAFKVIQSNTSDRIIVNTAEISNDSNDDIDSIPDNNIEKEDDIDKEYLKVQFFDLALKKWVTETIITVDGKTTKTKTGFTEDTDKIAKVDIIAKKLKKTTVKFAYNIKVINEGEIAGYAYEVKDYIPNGLKFVKEDNPDWSELKDGQVVTEKLKGTLLNPGESATVEIVLTWENSTTNLKLKTNYAEISNDSGNDIDSTPDNFNKKEDDIDDAQVILALKTDGPRTYIWLAFISITILSCGIVLIKKYVMNQ